tara:strand:- start:7462 stop:8055 length:594 start_codon:yes stop_codon:yes gene_type:complete
MTLNNSFKDHFDNYFIKLSNYFNSEILISIEKLAEDLMKIWESNNQLFICGNGGSAANAIHIANDLHYGLAQSVKSKKYGMKSDALPANTAIITCLANDTGYENIFSNQLRVKANKNDLLVVLSGSGNSENIVNALNVSNEIGLNNYAVLGFDGGQCKQIAKNAIHVPVSDMLVSEDIQMIIFNICFQWIVKKMNSI